MTILDDIRFAMQMIEDNRRILVCPDGLGEQVRAKADEMGVGGMYDVQESPIVTGHILAIDHNAIEASNRRALQRMKRTLFPSTRHMPRGWRP